MLLLNAGYKRELLQELDSSWAIMLDKSASMAFTDADNKSRWVSGLDIVKEVFQSSDNAKKIKLYTFSKTSTPVEPNNLKSLVPNGNDTGIVESGRNLLMFEKTRSSKLNGILLLSDGRQPVQELSDSFALRAAAQGTPIFPVVLGGKVPFKDLEINIPRLRHVSFKGQPVHINGSLVNNRMGPVTAEVKLCDTEGTVIEEKSLLVKTGESTPFSFNISLEKPGYYEYSIKTPLRQGESNRANNTAGIGVFVLTERLNILMLEGEPYWDTKFLSHLLRAQTTISMTAVFRVAQDRFFKVSTGKGMTTSDTDSFPKSIEAMKKYDLIVLGRGTEYFIDEHRANLLKDFVKNHGGCLFFARGKSYAGSESWLASLEPVKWGKPVNSDFIMAPLLGGEQAGLFGGLLPDRNNRLWRNLPPLSRADTCLQLNSFASVLANGIPVKSNKPAFPLLVSKRYGSGLVLMINGDGLWKWGFFPEIDDGGKLYQSLWLQLFQWAVSFAEFNPGSDYLIRTDKSTSHVNEPLRVRIRARAHVKTENIVVRVYTGNKAIQTIRLSNDSSVNGGWSGLVTLTNPGIYRLTVETPQGKKLNAQTTIQVFPPPGEQNNLSADIVFLSELAKKSGGRVITGKEIPALVKELEAPAISSRKGDVVWETMWDNIWVFALIMFFFSLEWFWRRRQGLS